MINLSKPNEWQSIDPETGLVFPWYTKSFLDELATWELRDKDVLEVGMGASTLWWNKKSRWVVAFELNSDWYFAVRDKMDLYRSTCFLPREGEIINAMKTVLKETAYDIAVIDCDPVEYRDPCAQAALQYLKPGGRLIIDNWDQPSVWVPSEETRKLLASYPCKIYKQDGHPDWQTAVFTV